MGMGWNGYTVMEMRLKKSLPHDSSWVAFLTYRPTYIKNFLSIKNDKILFHTFSIIFSLINASYDQYNFYIYILYAVFLAIFSF